MINASDDIYKIFDKDWVLSRCINLWHDTRSGEETSDIYRRNIYKEIIKSGMNSEGKGNSKDETCFNKYVDELACKEMRENYKNYKKVLGKIDPQEFKIVTTGQELATTPAIKSLLGDGPIEAVRKINYILVERRNPGCFGNDLLNGIPYNGDTHNFWAGIYLRLIISMFIVKYKNDDRKNGDRIVEIPYWEAKGVHSFYSIFELDKGFYQIPVEDLNSLINPSFRSAHADPVDINSVVTSFPFVRQNKGGRESFLTSYSLIIDSLSPFMFYSLRAQYWECLTKEFENFVNEKSFKVFQTFTASLQYENRRGAGRCKGFNKDLNYCHPDYSELFKDFDNKFKSTINFPGEIDGIAFVGSPRNAQKDIFVMMECKSVQNPTGIFTQLWMSGRDESSWKYKAGKKLEWIKEAVKSDVLSLFVIEGASFEIIIDEDKNIWCSKDKIEDVLNLIQKTFMLLINSE